MTVDSRLSTKAHRMETTNKLLMENIAGESRLLCSCDPRLFWLLSHCLLVCCRMDVSRLTPSMNEMIANFLLRMAFVRFARAPCYYCYFVVDSLALFNTFGCLAVAVVIPVTEMRQAGADSMHIACE